MLRGMGSPRLRPAVPLPTPATYPALRRVLLGKIALTAALWAAPALFLPPRFFPFLGIPEPPLEQIVFVRLLGAAYVALLVAYGLAVRSPARHGGAVLVGIVSNGLAALVILYVGAHGAFDTWGTLGAIYIWGSAVVAAGLAVALAMTGRPLLKKMADRPRPNVRAV
jgi:hypothetical protein